MNKSGNLHCSLGERRLAQHKNEMKNILTQDGFTKCPQPYCGESNIVRRKIATS